VRPRLVLAVHSLVLSAAAANVVEALREAGVRAIVLKGPIHAHWLYADEGRWFNDVDLLVDEAGLAIAETTLAGLGFGFVHDDAQGRVWRRRRDGVAVDVHWTLPGVGVPNARAFALLAARTETFELEAGAVEGLDEAGRTLHVALHAANHGTEGGRFLHDLQRAVERIPHSRWQEAAGLARSLEADGALAVGLRLVPEGDGLARDLGLPSRGPAEVELWARRPMPALGNVIRLSRTPGVPGKLALLKQEAFPGADFMRTRSDLARRGSVGLAAAYALRLVKLTWQVPRAHLALRRARRASNRR